MAITGLVGSEGMDSNNARDSQKTSEKPGIFEPVAKILDPSNGELSFSTRIENVAKALANIEYPDNPQAFTDVRYADINYEDKQHVPQKLVIPGVTPNPKAFNSKLDFESRSQLIDIKMIVSLCQGAFLTIQNSPELMGKPEKIEEALKQIFTVTQQAIKNRYTHDTQVDLINKSRALRKSHQAFNKSLNDIVQQVADVLKVQFDDLAKAKKELRALSQADHEAKLEVHNDQLKKIENSYLVELLKHPDRTGHYLTATDDAFVDLNSIVWMVAEDENNIITVQEEREFLKTRLQAMGVALSETQLTAMQQENAHLRKTYNGLKEGNKNLSTETLREMANYKAMAHKYRSYNFDALKPGQDEIVNAIACFNSGAMESWFSEVSKKNKADVAYIKKISQLSKDLQDNSVKLFGAESRFIESTKSSDEIKIVVPKRSKKEAALNRANTAANVDPKKVGEFLTQRSELLNPETIQLLQTRQTIIREALSTLKKGQNKKILNDELAAVKTSIRGLQNAISREKVVDKTIADLKAIQAELGALFTQTVETRDDFVRRLDKIERESQKLKFSLENANSHPTYESVHKGAEKLIESLDQLTTLKDAAEKIKLFEKYVEELEVLNQTNDQLVHFKALLKQLKSPVEKHELMTWQQPGILAARYQQLNSACKAIHEESNTKSIQALEKLHTDVDYQTRNVFLPQEAPEQKTVTTPAPDVAKPTLKKSKETKKEKQARLEQELIAKEKHEKDMRRKNHKEYTARMKKLTDRITAFHSDMHVLLRDNDLELNNDELTPNNYLLLQKKVIERSKIKVAADHNGTKLTPAQAIAEIAIQESFILQQSQEFAVIYAQFELAFESPRRPSMQESKYFLELNQIKKTIGEKRSELIADLARLEDLRLTYKKLYLKSALINPFLIDLVEKYPNIFSDNLVKQQEQVEICNKAFLEGFSYSELDEVLTYENLQIGITPKEFEKVVQINRIPEIFDAENLEQLQALLSEREIDVSSDSLKKFLAFNRNDPDTQEKLKTRAKVIIAQEQLEVIHQRFNETRKDYTVWYEIASEFTKCELSLDGMDSKFQPVEHAKQLTEMLALVETVTTFDYDANLSKLANIQSVFAQSPKYEREALKVKNLSQDIQSTNEFTAALVLKTNKLEGYYKQLLEKFKNKFSEVCKKHYSLLVIKINKENNPEAVKSYLKASEDLYKEILQFQSQFSDCLKVLNASGALPSNNIARKYLDKLQELSNNLAPHLARYLKTHEGEQGRISIAENRLKLLENEATHVVSVHKRITQAQIQRKTQAQILGERMFGTPGRTSIQRGLTQNSVVAGESALQSDQTASLQRCTVG